MNSVSNKMSSKRSTQNSTDSEPYLITEFLDPKLRSSTESGSSTDLKDSITYVKFDVCINQQTC